MINLSQEKGTRSSTRIKVSVFSFCFQQKYLFVIPCHQFYLCLVPATLSKRSNVYTRSLENSKLPLFVKISKRTRADDSSAVLEKRTADMLRGWDFSFYSMSLIFFSDCTTKHSKSVMQDQYFCNIEFRRT